MIFVLTALNRASIALCALAILSMTLLGGMDVIATAALGKPIPGTYEFTETFMVIAVFLALGYLHQERAYIAVDILYERFGFRVKLAADYLSLVLITVLFSLIAWRAWGMALQSWRVGEYSVGLIQFPIYPSKFAFAIGCSLLVIGSLADFLKGRELKMRNVGQGNDDSDTV